MSCDVSNYKKFGENSHLVEKPLVEDHTKPLVFFEAGNIQIRLV
jgi:hypothetical protein